MRHLLICRACGTRAMDELATNQKELADVGMLERKCIQCGADTRWGLAQDYRSSERRSADRRRAERRESRGSAQTAAERRAGPERRSGPVRQAERRAARA